MTRSAAARARLAALIVGACLICGGTFSVSPARADTAPVNPADPASPLTVSADALPTTQIDGVAWSQVVVGNTVYVAGKFTTARPAGAAPGTNTVPRNNLLAYDITTGKLVDGFAPNLNAQALAVTASPDGTRIYVAGDFTSIDGAGYYRLAAFSTATGKIIPEFRPIMGSQTRALAATNSTVYAGGTAQTVNGLPRTNLAAINATNGSTLSWTANTDAPVYALALTKDGTRLVVGGRFENLGGSPAYGLGAVDPVSGSVIPWAAAAQVRNAGTAASITSLTATDDRVYGSGYVFGAGGNLEGIFSADPGTGKIAWVEDCHGDTYSVYPLGDSVYGAGHPHYCGNIGGYPETNPRTQRYMLAFSKAATGTITRDPHGYFNWAGTPAPTLLNWFPSYVPGTFSGQGQSTWTVAGNDEYLAVGGEFPFVNGVAQSGLTRHAITALTPNAIGPSVNPELVPTAVSITAGAARISWAATFDNDNSVLTYALVRDGDLAAPVYTTTQSSNFYTRPLMGFVDKGLAPGSEHSYRLYVTDPWGNSVSRLGNTVTIVAADASDTYSAAVLADQPRSYWPLSEASGSAGLDHAGLSDLQLGTGVTRGAPGIQGSVTASRFSGNTTGFAATQTAQAAPNTFSVESWFRTSSTTGGKIVGYGNNNTKPSTKYDRHVYMDNSGRLFFGVNPGSARTISSPGAYNDGVWHQVVATLGPEGMRLFVDGKQVAARSDIIAGEAFDGYWRVGGDSLGSWASHPLSSYLNGDIAQVSVYPAVLTRQAVRDHFVASGRAATTTPTPTDAYGAAISASDPLLYWRLGDAAGARAADSGLAGNTGTYAGTVTAGATGLVNGTTDTSASFTSGAVVSGVQDYAPRAYSLETWFTTTTTAGGKLIGFGDTPSGLSKTYDRHVYMQNDGTLVFGTWTGIANTAKTTQAYNDGQRHHVVATQSADGMKLYVDGVLAGTNPQVSAQSYAGYWRIGGDPTWGSSSPYFTGVLDEAAVYPRALSAAVVKSHHDLGTYVVPPNVAPTAAFTATSTLLTTAFDASTSTDTDGTITGYAWNFGDTTTDTGPTPTHTYAAAGTYTTTLTVTDNSGATATTTRTITATAPPSNTIAQDSFNRTTTNGWGTADVGGPWAHTGATNIYTTNSATARVLNATGSTKISTLTNVASTNTDTQVTLSADKTPTGGGTYVSVLGRVAGGTDYSLRAWLRNGATIQAHLLQGNTSLQALNTDLTYTPGTQLQLRLQTFGTSPTTIRAKIWPTGQPEPTTWQLTTTDTTPALQTPGAIGLRTYISASATNGPTTLTFDNLTSVPSPSNVAPTAAFTATSTLLTTAFDASTSTDTDGTITGYAWNFGDTTTDTGPTPTHTYAAAGTYTTTLTVTDNSGATATTTRTITVTAPPSNVAPTAAFTATSTLLTTAFDASTSTDTDGTITGYAWNFGDTTTDTGPTPTHTYAAAGTYTTTLTVTDNSGATATTTRTITATAPPSNTIAQDSFNRTTTNGWGTADVGGPWAHTGATNIYTTNSATARVLNATGSTKISTLTNVASTNTDTQVTLSADKTPTGGGTYVSVLGRVAGGTDYSLRAWLRNGATIQAHLLQGNTSLQALNTDLTYTPGTQLQLRLQTFGTSPTTIRAKIWPTGQPEPTTWQLTTTDTTPALQTPGAIGLRTYISASATNGPTTLTFDNLTTIAVP